MRTYEFLELAVHGFEKYGWIQGELGNSKKGMCALGGLSYAERIATRNGVRGLKQLNDKAVNALLETIAERRKGYKYFGEVRDIIMFNDDSNTSYNDVKSVFQDTIVRLRKRAHR